MKTLICSTIFLLFCSISFSSNGQFLKKLGDKIEKSVDRRIERRTDQAVEKSLDKVENEAEEAVNTAVTSAEEKPDEELESPSSSWPVGNMEGANVQEVQPLPKNYELTLTGTGPDLYLEYQMRFTGEQMNGYNMNMRMKMYASPDKGGGRSEVIMQMPMLGEMSMVTLTNFNDPARIVLLNERKKKYSIMDLNESKKANAKEKYTVTKIGEENLHGLHCVHSKATAEDGQQFEIWTTKEIPGYETMMKLYSKNQKMGSDNLWKAMKEAGSDGFLVKLKVEIKEGSSIMEITRLEKTTVSQSMLEIPAGYKESNGGWTKAFMR